MLKLRNFYYITHVENLPSILQNGILCHRKVEEEKVLYTPIYDREIVENRKNIQLKDGKNLWDFVNLYFQPRNAMLYRIMYFSGVKGEDVCIIGVTNSILNRGDIFITDGNAASYNTQFYSGKDIDKNLKKIREMIDKEWWANEDGSKRQLMAECLVPERVLPDQISEIYVPDHAARLKVEKKISQLKIGREIPVIPEPELFFLPSRKITLTPNLSLVEGDMFFSRKQTLTISVNTLGVMGKGVASRAKYQFPDVYVLYQDLCKKGILKMGEPYLYKREASLDLVLAEGAEKLKDLNLQTWFLLFPTKTDWRQMADLKGIMQGLKWLVDNYKKEGIKSLALPALGCGLGWLPWAIVGPILCQYLMNLDIPVDIHLPLEQKIPDVQLSPEYLIR